ncbi:MAG TPA: HD domain-containing protein [Syntrophorhabdales bacterium]|nr:HD domain-containing protein [Syntrophorhabdales bacterium]
MSVSRKEAFHLVKQYITDRRLIRHVLAVEAVMRALARKLGRDEEQWGLAGLLHDIDIEVVERDFTIHGSQAGSILTRHGLDHELIDAVLMHNESWHGRERTTEFQQALAASDRLTFVIISVGRALPDKMLHGVTVSAVMERIHSERFRAMPEYENILECEKIGIPLAEFVTTCLDAMKRASDKLGM